MILNETYTLSNSVKIPKLGLGTWMLTDSEAAPAVDVNLQDLYPTFASHCNQKIYATPRFGIFFLFENKTPLN